MSLMLLQKTKDEEADGDGDANMNDEEKPTKAPAKKGRAKVLPLCRASVYGSMTDGLFRRRRLMTQEMPPRQTETRRRK